MTVYEQRDYLLKTIGFNSYAEYLASDLWKAIRSKVLSRDRKKCLVCQERATEVHHTDYELRTLKGLNNECLKSICSICHTWIEFDNGSKVSLREANSRISLRKNLLNRPVVNNRPSWLCECGNTAKKGKLYCGKCGPKKKKQRTPEVKIKKKPCLISTQRHVDIAEDKKKNREQIECNYLVFQEDKARSLMRKIKLGQLTVDKSKVNFLCSCGRVVRKWDVLGRCEVCVEKTRIAIGTFGRRNRCKQQKKQKIKTDAGLE